MARHNAPRREQTGASFDLDRIRASGRPRADGDTGPDDEDPDLGFMDEFIAADDARDLPAADETVETKPAVRRRPRAPRRRQPAAGTRPAVADAMAAPEPPPPPRKRNPQPDESAPQPGEQPQPTDHPGDNHRPGREDLQAALRPGPTRRLQNLP